MRAILAAACAMLLTAGVAAEHDNPFAQMGFLAGDWRHVADGKTTEEHWVGPVGNVMAGMGITYAAPPVGKANVEFMTIELRDDKIAFVARIDGQPPTVFPLKESDNGYAVFENTGHDFPQRVIYRIGGDNFDQLEARIEGTIDGKEQSVEWRYRRIAE